MITRELNITMAVSTNILHVRKNLMRFKGWGSWNKNDPSTNIPTFLQLRQYFYQNETFCEYTVLKHFKNYTSHFPYRGETGRGKQEFEKAKILVLWWDKVVLIRNINRNFHFDKNKTSGILTQKYLGIGIIFITASLPLEIKL